MRGHLTHRYLIALGSNVRHHRYGRPRDVLVAAVRELRREALDIQRVSPIQITRPLGPSLRRYANCALLAETRLAPEDLLALLKRTEARFGIRRGQRWGARVLDCDIILWDGGSWFSKGLTIPHPEYRKRGFVLAPAVSIASVWRDPICGNTIRQSHTRLTRPRPAPSGKSQRLPAR